MYYIRDLIYNIYWVEVHTASPRPTGDWNVKQHAQEGREEERERERIAAVRSPPPRLGLRWPDILRYYTN